MQNYLIDNSICIYWEHSSKDEMKKEEEEEEENRRNNWRWVVYMWRKWARMKWNKKKETESTKENEIAAAITAVAMMTTTTTKKKENNYQDATLTVDTTIKMRWASLIYLVHGTLSSCRSMRSPYPHNLVFNTLSCLDIFLSAHVVYCPVAVAVSAAAFLSLSVSFSVKLHFCRASYILYFSILLSFCAGYFLFTSYFHSFR